MLHSSNSGSGSGSSTGGNIPSSGSSISLNTPLTISSVMSEIKDKFKSNEDEEMVSPFQGLDKATVLQETKIFSDANTVTKHPRKCCQLITKLLHLLTANNQEPFTSKETTDVFFGVTKLFQSKDANLRRMMYLFIKEVAEATAADEVIIVTQSLTKDMNSDIDLYRANAIRVLCRIIDTSMFTAIERYIKQAIVDKNSLVSSSALVSGIHLMKSSPEIVRRWVNEVQEGMSSSHDMVQYHAATLLYSIRQHDKQAVSKFVTQLQKQTLRSPLATCLLIRYTAKILSDDMLSSSSRAFYQFLESMLRHKSEMVIYEAARAICALPIDARDLSPAISVLQLFLSSPKPTLRFAAVRSLSFVAMTQPMVVTKCNEDMEALISDSNRSIATLAITTLLKTGAESSVDRLMKQISTFMGDIADEFKIVVVEAIRNLCLKYPQKNRVLLNFLANFLREEGGFEFKKTITETILNLIDRIPECKETGLLHLCEFIEDCEFTQLSVKILHVLGEQGPATSTPARFIRFIYNRVILENAIVRASAVSALAQFAICVESLKKSVMTLLKRCLQDDDDEVRDRATLYLSIVENEEMSKNLLIEPLSRNPIALLKSLEQYQLRPSPGPVTLDVLPHVEIIPERCLSATKTEDEEIPCSKSMVEGPSQIEEDPAKELYRIPEFAELGTIFRSSKSIDLTEAETEYVVKCIKHIFAGYIVLQFTVVNTVKDQLLSDIVVGLQLSNPNVWKVQNVIPIKKLPYDELKSIYVSFKHNKEAGFPLINIANELKFKVYEVDSTTGEPDEEGFDEEYPLEQLEISAADFIAKVQVQDFRSAWEQIGDDAEVREQYGLQYKNISEGVAGVISNLGLCPCDNTGTVQQNAKLHVMLLSGVFLGGIKILVKCKLTLDASQNGAVLLMAVRSEDPVISQTIADCIR